MFSVMGATLLAMMALSLGLGAVSISIDDMAAAVFGGGDVGVRMIVWEIRFPRAMAAAAAGFALGMAGAALQGLLRNPLADPGVLGVTASSSLFATTALFFGAASMAAFVMPFAAIIGALAATLLLAIAAARVQSIVALLLIGVGLSSVCGALMAVLLNVAPNPYTLADLINWTLGTVANRSLRDLAIAAPFLALGAFLLLGQTRAISLLALGEEGAAGAGLDVVRTRTRIVVGAGLLAGAAVSLAGAIGFVGLIAGHVVRPFVGHDPGRALAPAGFLGAIMLVGADLVVRVAPTATELKLGVIIALLGAPAFIWIAAQRGARDG
jgi:iron complex transport system permease protein